MKHCLFTFPKFNINFHLSGIQNLQRQHTSMWSFVHLLTGRNHEATYDCHRNTAIEHVNFPQLFFYPTEPHQGKKYYAKISPDKVGLNDPITSRLEGT